MPEEVCDCGSDECPTCFPEDDVELEMFNLQFEAHDPEDEPMPTDLLPEPGADPIEMQRVNHANVSRLLKRFGLAVTGAHEQPIYGPIHDIDVLKALQAFTLLFVKHVVLHRVDVNPTAAKCNQVAVLKAIEELNDEVLRLDLPSPQVN